jgi:hypothetical protein
MRFVRDAEVFDAARNTDRDGRDVFKHIVAPAEEPRVYLKCKFSLAKGVNDDTSRVAGPGTPTWAELFSKSKGKVHCEPDLIVRTKTAIKIYELKMGLGKPESNTEPKEYNLCEDDIVCPVEYGEHVFTNWYLWPESLFEYSSSTTMRWFDNNNNEILCARVDIV